MLLTTEERDPELFDFGQQTSLWLVGRCNSATKARPNSVDRYRVPARSPTAIVEPFEAMQPVSILPFVHVGRPSSTAAMFPSGLIGRR